MVRKMPKQHPALNIVAGPDTGLEVQVKSDAMVIGRGSKADLTLGDRLLSRQHARLFKAMDGWYVEDMASTNGTWIQGQAVTMPTRLLSGQRFRVGKTVLELFIPCPVADEGQFDQTMISFWLDPGSMESLTIAREGGEGQMRREREKLAAIYEVQGLLRSEVSDDEMYSRILGIITRVVPSDIAYLLLLDAKGSGLIPVARETEIKDAREHVSAYISGSMINYVREHHQSVLSSDKTDDTSINQTYVSGMKMNSIMCAPLLAGGELLGMIYVMSTQGSHIFEHDDLRLLSAIAQSAAMAIENSRLMARNVQAERMAAIGLTAAGLAHYVKNILAGLEGSISLLRLGMDGDNHKTMDAAWQILNSNHRRLSSLMLDLLSLSKELKLSFARHNAVDIVKDVVALSRNQVKDDNIEIVFEPEPATIMADIDNQGLHRILLNLLNNAIDSVRQKHGESGAGRIHIDASIDQETDTLVISVTDNGIGVPEPEREVIFESFHTTKGDRGTGLGLAVCRRIASGHNGRISISCQEKSTTFWVEIPVNHGVTHTARIQSGQLIEGDLLSKSQ